MAFPRERPEVLGATVALLAFVLSDTVFVARLAGSQGLERLAGLALLALSLPTAYLVWWAARDHRPAVYVGWLVLFLVFLLAEALLDYVFELPFREVRWQLVAYVMLFFGSLGGMIGVAGVAGRRWAAAAVVGFLSTVLLAFAQHRATGL